MSILLLQAQLATISELQMRASMVASIHGLADPDKWARDNRYKLAATPGWAQLVQQGIDETGELKVELITDEMVIDAVENLLEQERPVETPPETVVEPEEPEEDPSVPESIEEPEPAPTDPEEEPEVPHVDPE